MMRPSARPRPWRPERLRAWAGALRGWLETPYIGGHEARLWPIAVVIGVVTGYAVIGFRLAISELQTLLYGADDLVLHSHVAGLPWYLVLGLPILGGLIVGVILTAFTPDGRARGVADVIYGAALSGGRVEQRAGLASAGAALVTLSTGGSTGREGPAVHIGAVIASWVSDRLRATGITGRDILGCAAAAAVSASFNAPLAGALFAMEVVLRHYAVQAFGPIVLASVAATVVGRIHLGDVTEYMLPGHTLAFYWEMPAFMLLGVLAGGVAVVLIRGVFLAEAVGNRVQAVLAIPNWMRPAAAGALLGLIALVFPHVIGVGYETTSLALTAQVPLLLAVVYAVVKVVAVAITLAGRMGGGVFSPALMVGALTGSAFGEIAIQIFPHVSGGQGLYALAGMGAVAGAVLGAPISSILIVIELTDDWQAGLAVMLSVALASVVTSRFASRSFFLSQLDRKGVFISSGPQGYLKRTILANHVMRPRGAENGAADATCIELYRQGAWLKPTDSLERALPMFDRLKGPVLPVMAPSSRERPDDLELIGAVFHVDAVKAYARTLEEELREEHS